MREDREKAFIHHFCVVEKILTMSYPGALPPPPGVTPNLNGGNPLEATYTASLVVMLLFPAVMVPLRLYTKAYIIKSLKATDCKRTHIVSSSSS